MVEPNSPIPKSYSLADSILFPTDDPSWIRFEFGAPHFSLLPTELMARATVERLGRSDAARAMQYGPVLGSLEYREELAKFLTREYNDVPVAVENLATTNGASQSFFDIVTWFATKNTKILIENPTYFLAIRMLQDHGIPPSNMFPLATDDEGIMLDSLESTLGDLRAADPSASSQTSNGLKRFPYILYCVATYSNPRGSTLPDDRRRRLVELAKKYDILVVSDDVYQTLHFDPANPPPPRLCTYDDLKGFGNVISNGSFSKILAPGVRLGWVEAGRGLIRQIESSGLMYSGGSPNHYTSNIITTAMCNNSLSDHLAHLRKTYLANKTAVVENLKRNLPSTVTLASDPSGGFFIWINLPPTVDTFELLRILKSENEDELVLTNGERRKVNKEKVTYAAGKGFVTDDGYGNCLRLSYAYYLKDDLVEGVERLCRVLQSVC
ncbi:hypothetical protein HDV00_005907 [Rhizophlyctis rosea]|nr:hypothetical protein HDV00_005907 [Rhizophlyctis rosea]